MELRSNVRLWVITVLPFSLTCSFICTRRTSLMKNKNNLARSFNFTFRYIDDVLSLNNCKFGDFIDSIHPIELEIKETSDTARSASYLDLHLEIDNDGRLRTKIYNKRDDFNFSTVNFSFMYSNIPAAPAYGYIYIYTYQLISIQERVVVPIMNSLREGCF